VLTGGRIIGTFDPHGTSVLAEAATIEVVHLFTHCKFLRRLTT